MRTIMILSGPEILRLVERTKQFKGTSYPAPTPLIEIEPFNKSQLNPNSYNMRLGNKLLEYGWRSLFDTKRLSKPYREITIPEDGYCLNPGCGYLGSTVERTYCEGLVPTLDGRSSCGRMFLMVHVTAGYGDDGFNGQWTVELVPLIAPVIVYPGDELLQIRFSPVVGERLPYQGKYQNQEGPTVYRFGEDNAL